MFFKLALKPRFIHCLKQHYFIGPSIFKTLAPLCDHHFASNSEANKSLRSFFPDTNMTMLHLLLCTPMCYHVLPAFFFPGEIHTADYTEQGSLSSQALFASANLKIGNFQTEENSKLVINLSGFAGHSTKLMSCCRQELMKSRHCIIKSPQYNCFLKLRPRL